MGFELEGVELGDAVLEGVGGVALVGIAQVAGVVEVAGAFVGTSD